MQNNNMAAARNLYLPSGFVLINNEPLKLGMCSLCGERLWTYIQTCMKHFYLFMVKRTVCDRGIISDKFNIDGISTGENTGQKRVTKF